jgi:hypothetical protein
MNNDGGISVLFGSTDNTIIGNYVNNNLGPGIIDLLDSNPNCDSNVWRGNDFGTSFPASCIH